MSDISQIQVGSEIYDITDDDALHKSTGGQITGDISIKKAAPRISLVYPGINRDEAPASTSSFTVFSVGDGNENSKWLGRIFNAYNAEENYRYMGFYAYNTDQDNGNQVSNGISFIIDGHGSRSVSVTDPKAFRNGIGAENGIFPVSVGGTGVNSYSALFDALMNDASTLTLNNSAVFTNRAIWYRKIGKWVEVGAHGIKLVEALTASSIALATLPSGYRPTSYTNGGVDFRGGNSTSIDTHFNISSAGVITMYKPTSGNVATTSTINFHTMFLTD